MVLENFYSIVSKVETETNKSYSYDILINNAHEIFKGHFPGNPIMPGVCMMQITKDIAESISGNKLFMKKCSNVKFMAIINPDKNKDLNLQITISPGDNGEIKVRNTTKFEDTIALKLSAIYEIVAS